MIVHNVRKPLTPHERRGLQRGSRPLKTAIHHTVHIIHSYKLLQISLQQRLTLGGNPLH